MRKQYRIRTQYDELEGNRTSTLYIPEYRSIWTLFCWRRLSVWAVYGTKLDAEIAIKIHRGDVKTVKNYEKYEG